MEYFAYGSNMNPERMKQRIGWSPPSRGAVLQEYQLLFAKQSNDGGKANIRPLKGEAVAVSYTHLTLPTKRIV